MSNPRAWLTPDAAPAQVLCWRVFLPDGEKWEAAFRGALALLAAEENWEQFGTLTPEEAAQVWVDANYQTFAMARCQEASSGVAIGTVFWFASETPPTGALLCDGSDYPTATYPDLYAIVGNAFGGDASDFNVPDLRGQFIRSIADGLDVGDVDGAQEHTLTIAELPEHTHPVPATIGQAGGSGSLPFWQWNAFPLMVTGATGGDTPHNNMPEHSVLVAMIQAE